MAVVVAMVVPVWLAVAFSVGCCCCSVSAFVLVLLLLACFERIILSDISMMVYRNRVYSLGLVP